MAEASRGTSHRRLLDIINALIEGERLDRYAVASRFGITEQTAHRYLTWVSAALPVCVEQDGRRRVYVFDRRKLESTPSLAEALAASFGAGFAKVFRGTAYEAQLRDIRERIIRRLGEARQEQFRHIGRKLVVLSHHEELLPDRQDYFDEVLEAVLRHRVLAATYQHFNGRREELRLTPYSLVISAGRLYVVAPDPTGRPHPYRFARFIRVDATSSTFNYPSPGEYDPEVLFRDSLGVFLNLPVSEVRLHVHGRWAVFLQTHRWHPSQTITHLLDGTIELRLLVRQCPELERWILGFGPEAEVLAPPELRTRIADCIRAAATRYGISPTPA